MQRNQWRPITVFSLCPISKMSRTHTHTPDTILIMEQENDKTHGAHTDKNNKRKHTSYANLQTTCFHAVCSRKPLIQWFCTAVKQAIQLLPAVKQAVIQLRVYAPTPTVVRRLCRCWMLLCISCHAAKRRGE